MSFAGLISFYGARRPPSNENISCRRGEEKRGAGKGLFNDYTQDVLAVETEDMSTTAIIVIMLLFSIIFSLCFYQEECMFFVLCKAFYFILEFHLKCKRHIFKMRRTIYTCNDVELTHNHIIFC